MTEVAPDTTATTANASPPRIELLAVGLLVIGAVGTWASFGEASKGGLDGDGVITLALALIVAGFCIRAQMRGTHVPLAVTLVAGLIALAIAIIDILDIRDTGLDVGWGLWLTLVGAIVMLGAAVKRLADR